MLKVRKTPQLKDDIGGNRKTVLTAIRVARAASARILGR